MERGEVVYGPHNQNNYYQKCDLSAFGPQKTVYWAACEKNLVIFSFTYSAVLFLFLCVEKEQAFINCSVSGNRKSGNYSWIYMRFWLGCQMWSNSRRPFRDVPTMSTREEVKPPIIKAMHILFTVFALLEFPIVHFIARQGSLRILCVCVCVAGLRQHWRVTGKLYPADKWHVGRGKRHCVSKHSQAKSSTPTPFRQTAHVSLGFGSVLVLGLYSSHLDVMCLSGCGYKSEMHVCLWWSVLLEVWIGY